MAVLGNLIVTGSSRLLNKLYLSDGIDIQGAANIGGALSVVGATTLSSLAVSGATTLNTFTTNGRGSINAGLQFAENVQALQFRPGSSSYYTAMFYGTAGNEALTFTTVNSVTSFIFNNGGYSTAHGGASGWQSLTNSGLQVKNNCVNIGGLWGNGVTPDYKLRVNGDTLTTNMYVKDTLKSTNWDITNIADLGGAFYVAPTLILHAASSGFRINSKSGNTLNVTVTNSSITKDNYGSVTWTNGSAIKFSGTVNGVVFGTCDGTLTANINGTNHTATFTMTVPDNVANAFAVDTTYSYDEIHLMLYKYNSSSGSFPVGILMMSDSESHAPQIDVFSGASNDPTVRIGILDGMPNIGDQSPHGWGIYTTNGYFSGTIVSASGNIGGWTLSNKAFSTGTWGTNNSALLCTGADTSKSIGGSPSINGWVFTAGANFGVTKQGALYANSAHITGEITSTSGQIGGFTIGASSLYNAKTSYDSPQAGVYLGIEGIGLGSGAFYVTDAGQLYANSATISGNITATSGTIGGCSIVNGVLKVASANITSISADVLNAQAATIKNLAAQQIAATSITAAKIQIKNTSGNILLDAGYSGANAVSIGGFTVTSNAIYNGQTSYSSGSGVYIGTDGIGLGGGAFYVTKAGQLYSNVGTIGGWTISSTGLASGNVGMYSGTSYARTGSDYVRFYAGGAITSPTALPFCVTNTGKLYATGATISGDITATAGTIGGCSITNGVLQVGSTSITNGAISTDKIAANAITAAKIATGTITSTQINASSIQSAVVTASYINTLGITAAKLQVKNGSTVLLDAGYTSVSAVSIAGFTVTGSAIYKNQTAYSGGGDGVYVGTDGIGLGGGNFYVTSAGQLFSNVGKIGGWTIGSGALYSGTSSLSSQVAGTYIGTDGIRQWASSSQYVDIKNGKIDAVGASISGAISATSGYIGGANGFTINSTSIYNGMTSLADTSHNGVYVGTDGIAIGKGAFKVTNGGVLTSTSGSIGSWTIGANYLSLGSKTTIATGNGIFMGTDGSSVVIALGPNKTWFKSDGSAQLSGDVTIGGTATLSGTLKFNNNYSIAVSGGVPSVTLPGFSVTSAGVVKLHGDTGLTVSDAGHISVNNKLVFKSGVNYGTIAQRNAIADPQAGEIFFVV